MLNRLLPGMVVSAMIAIGFGVANLPEGRREERLSLSERILFSGQVPVAARNPVVIPISVPISNPVSVPDFTPESALVSAPRGPENAYASMALPGDSDSVGWGIPSGIPPPLMMKADVAAAAYPPARGVRVWAEGGEARSRQKVSPDENAAYSMTEKRYSAGISYDWSIDTVLGVGVEMLDATVKSGHRYDSREGWVDGVFAKASVDTVLFDSWLLGLKGFYGKLGSGGGGVIGAWDDGGATTSPLREEDHGSVMYGASASVDVPMIFWGHRVLMSAGVDFKRLVTETHEYQVGAARVSRAERLSSLSLSFPVSFSMEKDFVKSWGLLTPRIGGGFTYETSGTAGGVRALHSFSAAPIVFDSSRFHIPPPAFASVPRGMYHVEAGLGVKTVGGWDAALGYRRDFAGEYSRDSFSLALGRSF